MNTPEPSNHGMTRRLWLQAAVGAAGLSLLPLLAQGPGLTEAVRRMAVLTGAELPERWLEPTSLLVSVILRYSEPLRALDLGEREPSTFFVAR